MTTGERREILSALIGLGLLFAAVWLCTGLSPIVMLRFAWIFLLEAMIPW